MHAGSAFMVDQMGAELVEEPEMRSFRDIIIVHRPEHRPEGIRVGDRPFAAGISRTVTQGLALADRQLAIEEACIVAAGEFAHGFVGQREGGDGFGVRNEAAGHQTLAGGLDPKQ